MRREDRYLDRPILCYRCGLAGSTLVVVGKDSKGGGIRYAHVRCPAKMEGRLHGDTDGEVMPSM